MGARNRWTAKDDYMIENWSRVRGLYEAFYDTQRRIRRHLKQADRKVQAWAEDHGFRSKVDRQWAEFKLWRPEWESQEKPRATFAVGAICPVGYFNVDQPTAYYGVTLDLNDDEQWYRVASKVRAAATASLGSSADHSEDWGYPVVFEAGELDDERRANLVTDPSAVAAKVTELFDKLLVIEPAVTEALMEQSQ